MDPESVWVIMDDLQHGTVQSVMTDARTAWAPFCPDDHLLPDPTQALHILEAALQETASTSLQQVYARNVQVAMVQEAVRPSGSALAATVWLPAMLFPDGDICTLPKS